MTSGLPHERRCDRGARSLWASTGVVLGAFVALAGLIAGAAVALRHHSPTSDYQRPVIGAPTPDPRLEYHGPFKNIHPSVAYAGSQQCAPCHQQIADVYAKHPMGRALAPVAAATPLEKYTAGARNPFEADGVRFFIDRRGTEVWHRLVEAGGDRPSVYTIESQVHYAIGSGARGRSYLTDRDGYLFQTPISWYTQKQIWDKSPGFQPEGFAGRPVGGFCLFCHADHANYREGSLNHFERPIFTGHAIGCERCHGPGALHVQTSHPDDIVDPKRLSPALRDAVCEQCHLEGLTRVVRRGRGMYDFRPGLALDTCWRVFVPTASPASTAEAVTHVEQMHQSRCYQASQGPKQMGCVSCHDPHRAVDAAERVSWYRGRCLECHRSHGCTVAEPVRRRQQADDSCIACHMPRYLTVDVAHNASTDHRVVRRRRPVEPHPHQLGRFPPITSFHGGPAYSEDAEMARDLGLALGRLFTDQVASAKSYGPQAIELLEEALTRDPEDVMAWYFKAYTLMELGRTEEALAAVRSALLRQPDNEACLLLAGALVQKQGAATEALGYWRKLCEINPWVPVYRSNLVQLLAHLGQWDEAARQCQDWLRLDPTSVGARMAWVSCLLHKGRKEDARAEFARIEALRPKNLERLREEMKKGLEGN